MQYTAGHVNFTVCFGEYQPCNMHVFNLRIGVKINAVQIAAKLKTGGCRAAAVLPNGRKEAVQREINHFAAAAERTVKHNPACQVQRAAVARKSCKLFNFAAFTANQCFKIDIAHLQITPAKAFHITGNSQICFAFYTGLPVNGKQTVQINSIFFKPFQSKIRNAGSV